MGMAASQARLLSITSRMSDNELRAQIINNNKMRLATESSQVSERYITALNNARYMFSNYDAENNVNYQALTFNNLTAYNAYNNQYALINSGGKILVSETDAVNYASSSNLDEFLQRYGLEKDTSYFNNLKTSGGSVLYSYTNSDGIVTEETTGFSPAVLKAAYYGKADDTTRISLKGMALQASDCGYDNTLNSPAMYNYVNDLALYTQKKDEYNTIVTKAMNEKFDSIIAKSLSSYGVKNYSELSTYLRDSSHFNNISDIDNLNSSLSSMFGASSEVRKYATNEGILYFDNAVDSFNQKGDNADQTEIIPLTTVSGGQALSKDFKIGSMSFNITWLSAGGSKIRYSGKNEEGQPINGEVSGTNIGTFNQNINGHNYSFDYSKSPATGKATITQHLKVTPSEKANITANILADFKKKITSYWDGTKEDFIKSFSAGSEFTNALSEYVDAANKLYKDIYGTTGSYTNTKTSGPPPMVDLDNITELYNKYSGFSEDFAPVFMNIVLDNVMNTYGEPKTTWINKLDPNENGMAKAQWYTNLYNRIKRSGYTVLKEGLASSPDWMKYAFESGLVTMEQVDNYNEWNQLIYTNCSDITEQTDEKAITIAEAEYNAAMNKIENKDKKYDLELKNIDTEHNSLQTEYDSIKAALDKNIERNFKLFG